MMRLEDEVRKIKCLHTFSHKMDQPTSYKWGISKTPIHPRKIDMEPETTPVEFRKMFIFGDVNGLKNWGFLGVLTLLVGDGAYLHLVVSQAVHLQRRWECYPTTSSEKSRFCCWAKCFFWPSQNHQVLIGFDFFPCKEKTPEGTVTIKADGAARSAQKIDSNPQPDKKPGPRRAETSRSHFQLAPLHYQLRPKVLTEPTQVTALALRCTPRCSFER